MGRFPEYLGLSIIDAEQRIRELQSGARHISVSPAWTPNERAARIAHLREIIRVLSGAD